MNERFSGTTQTIEAPTGRHHARHDEKYNAYDIIQAVQEGHYYTPVNTEPRGGRHHAPENNPLPSVYDYVDIASVLSANTSGRHHYAAAAPTHPEITPAPVEAPVQERVAAPITSSKEKRPWARRAITALGAAAMLATLIVHPWSSAPHAPQASATPAVHEAISYSPAPAAFEQQLTGDNTAAFNMPSADLGFPVALQNGQTAYFFGDNFSGSKPGEGTWNSSAVLFSDNAPDSKAPVTFTNNGPVSELFPSLHDTSGNSEFSKIPTTAIAVPELGLNAVVAEYMSVRNWDKVPGEDGKPKQEWATNYAGAAVSYDNGKHFNLTDLRWDNDAENNSPDQMAAYVRDGDYIYRFSNKAGRQKGDIIVRRVLAKDILNKDAYECWGQSGWGSECTSVISTDSKIGELSVTKLRDSDDFIMSYLKLEDNGSNKIVTRLATSLTGTWTSEKTQLTDEERSFLYGGYVDPNSTSADLKLDVSYWTPDGAYGVDRWKGTS